MDAFRRERLIPALIDRIKELLDVKAEERAKARGKGVGDDAEDIPF